jgi:magnesium transporter
MTDMTDTGTSAADAGRSARNAALRSMLPGAPALATWVDLLDPSPEAVHEVIPAGMHPGAVERLLAQARHDDEPRPRLEQHDDYVWGVLVVPARDDGAEHKLILQEVHLVVTQEELITVRKSRPGESAYDCTDVRHGRCHSDARPGMHLYHMLDDIAERFLSFIDAMDLEIDQLEDNVEEWDAGRVRSTISQLRHDMLDVRRVLSPTRDVARAILDDRLDLPGEDDLFPRDVELHFADAYDKLLRATDTLDLSRDLLAGVRDYHQAQVANDQNDVMKRLTVIASLLLLPTFIVGLYGQNLQGIPEYRMHHGYLLSWFLIIATTVAQLLFFRRKKWL